MGERRGRLRTVGALLAGSAAALVLWGLLSQALARGWHHHTSLGASWAVPGALRAVAPVAMAAAAWFGWRCFRTRRWVVGILALVTCAAASALLDARLYAPWSLYRWAAWSRAAAGGVALDAWVQAGVVGSAALVLGALVSAAWLNRAAGKETELGSARYATERELRRARLLLRERTAEQEPAGVILGLPRKGRGVIRTPAKPVNVLVVGPPRTGKGIGIVMPNVLDTSPVSRIVIDDKGEAWQQGSAWLAARGFHVLRLDPSRLADERTNSWNPLLELRADPTFGVGDAQRLAAILTDPKGSGERESPFFQRTSRLLMRALILEAVLGDRLESTLPGLARATSGMERSPEELLRELKEHGAHEVVRQSAASFLNIPPETRGNVEATVFSYLGMFGDPLMAQHLERSDFQLLDLVTAERPVALFLTVPEKMSESLLPWMRMFLQMLLWTLSDRLRHHTARWRLRIIADEFASFGPMAEWRSALGRVPGVGKGVDTVLIIQSATDLDLHYEAVESIADLCDYKVVLRSQGKTAEWTSKALGERSVTSANRSWQAGSIKERGRVSSQERTRPLITADEISRLGLDEVLIKAAGQHPYRGRLIAHYKDQPWAGQIHGEAARVARLGG